MGYKRKKNLSMAHRLTQITQMEERKYFRGLGIRTYPAEGIPIGVNQYDLWAKILSDHQYAEILL